MSPRRGSRASASKNDSSATKELRICREYGETYRPFTDPKRIETNDAKKASAGDSRARVKGVPDDHLHIMDFTELSPRTKEPLQSPQGQRVSVPVPDVYQVMPEHQQEALVLDAPAAHEVYQYSADRLPEAEYASPDGMISFVPSLRLMIPAQSTCHDEYHSSPGLYLPSSCHSTYDDASMSAYQQLPPQSVPPSATCDQSNVRYDEQADGTFRIHDFGTDLVNSAFVWNGSASLCSSDSNSPFESPGSNYSSDSFDSPALIGMPTSTCIEVHHEQHDHNCVDTHTTSHTFLGPYPNGPATLEFENQFLTGPETTTQAFSIPDSSPDSAGGLEYSDFVAETRDIVQNMYLEDKDLYCLSIDGNGVLQNGSSCFTGHGNPDVFLASCAESLIMSET